MLYIGSVRFYITRDVCRPLAHVLCELRPCSPVRSPSYTNNRSAEYRSIANTVTHLSESCNKALEQSCVGHQEGEINLFILAFLLQHTT